MDRIDPKLFPKQLWSKFQTMMHKMLPSRTCEIFLPSSEIELRILWMFGPKLSKHLLQESVFARDKQRKIFL